MTTWRQSLAQAGLGLIWGMAGAALVLGIVQMSGLTPRAAPLATVDMASLVQAERDRALQIAASPGSQAHDIAAAEKAISRFGQRLDRVLAELAAERKVVIVQRQAVAGGSLPDLTAEASRRLVAQETNHGQ